MSVLAAAAIALGGAFLYQRRARYIRTPAPERADAVRDIRVQHYVDERGLSDHLLTLNVAPSRDRFGVFHLDEGWVQNPLWLPVTHDRCVFLKFSRIYTHEKYDPVFTAAFAERLGQMRTPPLEHVFELGGSANYWHLMMDFMPRLAWLKAFPELRGYRVLIDAAVTAAQRDMIAGIVRRMNLPAVDLTAVADGVHPLRDAWCPGYISRPSATAIWDRDLYPVAERPASGAERLFVLRQMEGRRRLMNQDDVARVLEPFGFAGIDPGMLPFDQQVAAFSCARCIVGVHGAALTNFFFAPPGGTLVELYTNIAQPFSATWPWHAASRMSRSLERRRPGDDHHGDFLVDIESLLKVLRTHGIA